MNRRDWHFLGAFVQSFGSGVLVYGTQEVLPNPLKLPISAITGAALLWGGLKVIAEKYPLVRPSAILFTSMALAGYLATGQALHPTHPHHRSSEASRPRINPVQLDQKYPPLSMIARNGPQNG